MPKEKWVFRGLQGAGFEGPNSGSGDHFKGTKLSSLVRELVQNSMDAHNKNLLPVKIIIDLKKVKAKDFGGFTDIWPHIEACRDYQESFEKKNSIWKLRYQNSIDLYKKLNDVSVLCFHDSETTGLYGPVNGEPSGAFHAIKAQGLSAKQDGGSGGSFGHGAVAALLYSGIGAVFYYSKVLEKPKERFFGKVILQSHYHPFNKKEKTRSMGYYGNDDDEISPLLDENIPDWAKEFRKEHNLNVGTSVYVPYTYFNEDLFPETIISLIANFYIAFKENKLDMEIGGVALNSKNIDEKYIEYKGKFEDGEEDDIDSSYIRECFKSIDTVRKPDFTGSQEISNFGNIEWYLRVSPETHKRVGISRKMGMLITRKAEKLQGFNSFKNFDMFVCVKGELGNDYLQKLENPQHTQFQVHRINDLPIKEKEEILRAYNRFVRKVRDILKKHALSDSSNEILVDELAELFGELSNFNNPNSNDERGEEINISDGPLPTLKSTSGLEKSKGIISNGAGEQSGGNKKKKKGGINEGDYETVIPGEGDKSSYVSGKKYILENLRVGNIDANGKKITIFFDPPTTGNFEFKISKKGEHGSEFLMFDGNKNSKELIIKELKRTKVEILMEENITDFVVEGVLNEIKN